MRMVLMFVAIVVAALTVAAIVGCGSNEGHNLRSPGPLRNTGEAI